jgi:hypothetical protein
MTLGPARGGQRRRQAAAFAWSQARGLLPRVRSHRIRCDDQGGYLPDALRVRVKRSIWFSILIFLLDLNRVPS